MPTLDTIRLTVRPFVRDDLETVHRILDIELGESDSGGAGARRAWLGWTIANYEQLAKLHQPPYGDRAVVLKSSRELIGVIGYVPSFGPFGQLPSWPSAGSAPVRRCTPEFGLFYAMSLAHRGKGYATEAAQAMIDYAFTALNLRRIVATTAYNNEASIGVMRRLGMRIERNPFPEPAWFQVVGILDNHVER